MMRDYCREHSYEDQIKTSNFPSHSLGPVPEYVYTAQPRPFRYTFLLFSHNEEKLEQKNKKVLLHETH